MSNTRKSSKSRGLILRGKLGLNLILTLATGGHKNLRHHLDSASNPTSNTNPSLATQGN